MPCSVAAGRRLSSLATSAAATFVPARPGKRVTAPLRDRLTQRGQPPSGNPDDRAAKRLRYPYVRAGTPGFSAVIHPDTNVAFTVVNGLSSGHPTKRRMRR
jgi:hypothetical protein